MNPACYQVVALADSLASLTALMVAINVAALAVVVPCIVATAINSFRKKD